MVKRGAILLAALALATPVLAQEEAPVDELTFAVIEFTRAAPFIGTPLGCGGEDAICLTELFQGQATTVRHIDGEELPRRFTLRLPAHSIRLLPGSRLLVYARPFEDNGTQGYFASWWLQERFDGLYCVGLEYLQDLPEGSVRDAFENGVFRRANETRDHDAQDYRCIWSQ